MDTLSWVHFLIGCTFLSPSFSKFTFLSKILSAFFYYFLTWALFWVLYSGPSGENTFWALFFSTFFTTCGRPKPSSVIVYVLYTIFANLKRSLLNSFRISCWQVILGSINWMGCNAFCDLQMIRMCSPAALNSQSGDFIWNKKWMGSLQNPPVMIRNIPEFI